MGPGTARRHLPGRGGLDEELRQQRMEFIDHQVTAPPHLNQESGAVSAGFQLTLTGPTNATLYYTLDGSDPRLPQGGISSNAVTYADHCSEGWQEHACGCPSSEPGPAPGRRTADSDAVVGGGERGIPGGEVRGR